MEEARVKVSKVDSSNALKPVRKSRSKGKPGRKHKDGHGHNKSNKEGQSSSMFKSAWGFISGLYGNSVKDQQGGLKLSVTAPGGNEIDGETDFKQKTQSETFADVLAASSADNQGDSFKPELEEAPAATLIRLGPRQTSFPTAKRPSGLLPRQNSSGINDILLDPTPPPENESIHPVIHTSMNQNQIRSSYDKPKRGTPLPPLRLSNIFQNRMEDGQDGFTSSGNGKARGPGILNRAFFDSVHDQIRKIKSKPNTIIDPYEEEESTTDFYSSKQTSTNTVRRSSKTNRSLSGTKKESNGNVNINLTVQLAQVDGQNTTADLGDISIAGSTGTVIIDGRHSHSYPLAKVEACMQTNTEAEVWRLSEGSKDAGECLDMEDYIVGSFSKALEYTGDSLMTAVSMVTNMVPVDATEMNEDEMNANEGDLAITLMRMMGVPQELRHKIYLEACDEVEVLQDVTHGTIEALATVLKWVVGGSHGRKDLMRKTRALCAVHSEVDTNSEIWHQLQQDVTEITESVESAINEGVEDAQSASRLCSAALVEFVSTSNTSANFSHHASEVTLDPELAENHISKEYVQEDVANNNNMYNEPEESIVNLSTASSTKSIQRSSVRFDENRSYLSFSSNRPCYFKDPEASFLYSPDAFRQQLQKPVGDSGLSETSLRVLQSEKFDKEEDETFAEMITEREHNQRTLGGKLKDDLIFPQTYEKWDKDSNIDIVSRVQSVGRCEVLDDFVSVMGRLSKSFLPHFKTPIDQPDVNQNFQTDEDLDRKASVSATESPSETSSIESNPSIGSLSRVPPNSEVIFDKIKNDKKVLEDLTRLQQLVQELYENVTPLASQTDVKDFVEAESEAEEKCEEDFEDNESLPVAGENIMDSNSTISSIPNAAELNEIKTGSRIPILLKLPPLPSSAKRSYRKALLESEAGEELCQTSSNARSSTVSLYQSQRSSIAQKSVLEMDNPIAHVRNVSFCCETDLNNNVNNNLRVEQNSCRSLKSVASASTAQSSRSTITKLMKPLTTGRTRRNFVQENKSSVTSTSATTTTTASSSRGGSQSSFAMSTYSIFSSATTQSTDCFGNVENSEHSESKSSVVPTITHKTLTKKPPVPSNKSSTASTYRKRSSSSSYRTVKPLVPKSYQQIQCQRKDYRASAQEYLKSQKSVSSSVSSGSKNSRVSTATTTSASSSSSKSLSKR